MRGLSQVLGGVAFAALLVGVPVQALAAPAGPAGAQWYVETIGTACEADRSALEREIRLACDAVGGTCHVVASPKEAELRVVLDCSGLEDSWTLITRTIEGKVLATLDLSGPRADRLREAAVEVARDAAPERALATETLRFTLTNANPDTIPAPQKSERLTLVLGGRASTASGAKSPAMGGAHLLAGIGIAKSVRATLGVGADGGGSNENAVRAFRYGVGIAYGAPFDGSSFFGFAFEGGLAATSTYGASRNDGYPLPTVVTQAGYAQGTLTLAWPRAGVRPYAAVSAAALSAGPSHVMAGGEAGLAFALF
jgi:hypothetical protein